MKLTHTNTAERGKTSTILPFSDKQITQGGKPRAETNFTILSRSFLIESWERRKGPEECGSNGAHHNVCNLELNLSAPWERANSPLPFSPVNSDETSRARFLCHLCQTKEMFLRRE
jgi:hypothetical protein